MWWTTRIFKVVCACNWYIKCTKCNHYEEEYERGEMPYFYYKLLNYNMKNLLSLSGIIGLASSMILLLIVFYMCETENWWWVLTIIFPCGGFTSSALLMVYAENFKTQDEYKKSVSRASEIITKFNIKTLEIGGRIAGEIIDEWNKEYSKTNP
jgi:hypothetical protein